MKQTLTQSNSSSPVVYDQNWFFWATKERKKNLGIFSIRNTSSRSRVVVSHRLDDSSEIQKQQYTTQMLNVDSSLRPLRFMTTDKLHAVQYWESSHITTPHELSVCTIAEAMNKYCVWRTAWAAGVVWIHGALSLRWSASCSFRLVLSAWAQPDQKMSDDYQSPQWPCVSKHKLQHLKLETNRKKHWQKGKHRQT